MMQHIEEEFNRGSDILYFKAESKKYGSEEMTQKIQNRVMQAIQTRYSDSRSIEMIPNKSQMCYFFRITRS